MFYLLFSLLLAHFYSNFTTKKKKNVKKSKSFEVENMQEQDYLESFKSLGIANNKNKVLKFLHVCLLSIAKPILDCSLLKFMISNYSDNVQVLCSILQVLSFFPTQTRLVNHVLSLIIKKKNLTFAQRFLIFQAHRVKVMRQSSISFEANERINMQNRQSNLV